MFCAKLVSVVYIFKQIKEMNIFMFSEKLKGYPVFSTQELKLILGSDYKSSFLVKLNSWIKKGYIIQLRRGLYMLANAKDKINYMQFASKIYRPSYISLEFALNYYGIIPEAVFTVTSISTKKTAFFEVPEIRGYFSYQKIKSSVFGGFNTFTENGVSFNLAEMEKALMDFFYINRDRMDGSKENFESYRFSDAHRYNQGKILQFAGNYGNKKMLFLAKSFIKYYNKDTLIRF